MRESGGHLDLAQESLGADLGGDLRAEHLHRDLAIVAHVVRKEDDGHPAFAELTVERVAAGQGGGEAGLEGIHREGRCTVERILASRESGIGDWHYERRRWTVEAVEC